MVMYKCRQLLAAIFFGVIGLCTFMSTAVAQYYVVTNNDIAKAPNSVSVYKTGKNGSMTMLGTYPTGGYGLGSGTPVPHQAIYTDKRQTCVFAEDALGNGSGYSDIAAFKVNVGGSLSLVDDYFSPNNDSGQVDGVDLVVSGIYLYAAYNYPSQTIAVWQIGVGCTLTYRTNASSVTEGSAEGIAVTPNGNFLIAVHGGFISSYLVGDGNIGFLSTEFTAGYQFDSDTAVSVTTDAKGKWAIVADVNCMSGCLPTAIDVCTISKAGLLGTCAQYGGYHQWLGTNNIFSYNLSLSPDDTILFVNGLNSKSVQSLAFDEDTGEVSLIGSCVNDGVVMLPGDYQPGVIATVTATGKGAGIYVAQGYGGSTSYIDVLTVNSEGCLGQLSQSADSMTGTLASISSYPRRNP